MDFKFANKKNFYDVYNQYYYKVYGLCLKVLNNNHQDALEATQETFIQVFKSIDTLRDKSKLNFWINKIAISKCSYIIRKNKKKLEYYQSEINEEADNVTPEIIACENEKKKSILEAINKLSYKKRTVILLYYYNNLKIEEISGVASGKCGFTTLRAFSPLIPRAYRLL